MKKFLISTRHAEDKEYTFGPTLEAGYHTFGPIAELGHLPLLIPAQKITEEQAKEYITLVDSLVLMGGHDVNPKLYNEEKLFDSVEVNSYRDQNEISLIQEAIIQKKPIIGICRGMQIINVALGGSLYQDLEQQGIITTTHSQARSDYNKLSHKVSIKKDSFLENLYHQDTILVNSFHHQAVKELGKGLVADAKSEDGVIEAMHHDSLPIYAVQRHPERSYFFDKNSIKIMEYFCNI